MWDMGVFSQLSPKSRSLHCLRGQWRCGDGVRKGDQKHFIGPFSYSFESNRSWGTTGEHLPAVLRHQGSNGSSLAQPWHSPGTLGPREGCKAKSTQAQFREAAGC